MKKTYFPEEFTEKYSKLLGKEWDEYFATIKRKQPKSIWVNTNKTTVEETVSSIEKQGIKLNPLKFHEQAFMIECEKPGSLKEFEEGKISLQEKAAMLPVVALNPKKSDYVLDCCSAPGMKTIQLSNLSGKVFATELSSTRFESLQFNKKKYALKNVELKRTDFRNVKEKFDKIVLDVPCSSEGLVRKKRDALKGWSQKLVERKAKNQKEMILTGVDMLKENGEIVYSTCSFAPEENEEVVNFLLSERNAEVLKIDLSGLKIRKNELCVGAARLFPQDNDTQPFFFAKLKKKK